MADQVTPEYRAGMETANGSFFRIRVPFVYIREKRQLTNRLRRHEWDTKCHEFLQANSWLL